MALYPVNGIDIDDIDWEKVTLEGVPATGAWDKEDYLLVKFDPQAVIATLGPDKNGELIAFKLEGSIKDNLAFLGKEAVKILIRGN